MKNKPWDPVHPAWNVTAGPVEAHLVPFGTALSEQGYSPLSVGDYVRSAAHFGVWLDSGDIPLLGITDEVVANFGRHLCWCRGAGRHGRPVSRRYLARVRRFVAFARQSGFVHDPSFDSDAAGAIHPLLEGFEHWSAAHRGLRPRTIQKYMRVVMALLPSLGEDPQAYDAALMRKVVHGLARGRSRADAKSRVTALRAFIRFLAVRGDCSPHLVQAIPTLPQWRLAELPRYLEGDQLDLVLASCSGSTRRGVRDRAVILLLARLGLRAGDIMALCFGDIDWNRGTLRVMGKGRKEVLLPLPQEVGDALLAYLAKRQPSDCLKVFLCDNAPVRPFGNSSSVSGIVQLALRRAGVQSSCRGAHLLRHTAATAMLRSGSTLEAVASVLRHESVDTTAHYAKVDVRLLSTIAQPWPEVAPC